MLLTGEINIAMFVTAVMLLSCAGNDNLYLLTSERRQELRVDLEDWKGKKSTLCMTTLESPGRVPASNFFPLESIKEL